jgi:hypothetical protein
MNFIKNKINSIPHIKHEIKIYFTKELIDELKQKRLKNKFYVYIDPYNDYRFNLAKEGFKPDHPLFSSVTNWINYHEKLTSCEIFDPYNPYPKIDFFNDDLSSRLSEKQIPFPPKGDSPIEKRDKRKTSEKKKSSQKGIKDLNFIVRIDEAIELEDTIEMEDTIELEETIEFEDTIELEETIEFEDTIELEETIEFEEIVKLGETVAFKKTVKLGGLEGYIGKGRDDAKLRRIIVLSLVFILSFLISFYCFLSIFTSYFQEN